MAIKYDKNLLNMTKRMLRNTEFAMCKHSDKQKELSDEMNHLRSKIRDIEANILKNRENSIAGKIFKEVVKGHDDFYDEIIFFKPIDFNSEINRFRCGCITITKDFHGQTEVRASTQLHTIDSSSIKNKVSEEEMKKEVGDALDRVYSLDEKCD